MSKLHIWIVRLCFIIWIIFLYGYVKTPPFNFLGLNTLLAYIPIEISFHIDKLTNKSKLLFWLVILLWLLFYPNTPYLLTDLFHLSLLSPYGANGLIQLTPYIWINFALLIISAFSATLIGMNCLDAVVNQITQQLKINNSIIKWLIVIILTTLSSIGIFIGRFLRIHTVYLFLTPLNFIKPLMSMWSHDAIIFITILTIVQLVIFSTIKIIKHGATA